MSKSKLIIKIDELKNEPIFIAFNGYIVQITNYESDKISFEFNQNKIFNQGEGGTYGNPIPPKPINPPKTDILIHIIPFARGEYDQVTILQFYKEYLIKVNISQRPKISTGAPIMPPPRPMPPLPSEFTAPTIKINYLRIINI